MDVTRAVLALLLTLVAVTSCSGRSGGTPLAALVVVGTELTTVQQMIRGFATGVRQVGGVRHREFGPRIADTAEQLRELQAIRKPAPDSYTVFTFNPELFAEPLAELSRTGVPIVALQCPPAPSSEVPLLVGNDNRALGSALAKQLARQLPPDVAGTVILGNPAPGVQTYDERAIGFRETLTRQFPRIRVIGPFDTKLEPELNHEAWDVLVRANPRAVAFVGVGDVDSGNIAAVRTLHRGRWAAAGIGLAIEGLRAAEAGDLVLVSGETFLQGLVAGRVQAEHLRYGTNLPSGWVQVPALVITRDNAPEILARQRSSDTAAAWFAEHHADLLDHPERFLRPLTEAAVGAAS
ncbi:sugar ABC transporter substrate-binding protein [Cryptosporangium sp. NPDC048952]|uniref:sugar ABC transporter substrate-binding protein n=1 Tax=Cryptosporangium sp. NPDC048952 TaxID=3363961 RepID=UPI003717C773